MTSTPAFAHPSTPRRPARSGARRVALTVTAGLALAGFSALPPAAAASTCTTTTTATGAVDVCLTAPTTATGAVTVSATSVASSGTPAATAKVEFLLDGAHLLTDFSPPFTFTLSSQDFADASPTLAVRATLRDGTVTDPASQPITFANGNATAPVNTGTYTPPTAPAPAGGAPFVVAMTGDGASGEPAATAVSDMITGWNPGGVGYLGDVYEKGTLAEMRNWYGDGTTWFSRLRAKTAPVVGNHEYHSNPDGTHTAEGYFSYWDNVPSYYSYDAGGWHFVVLDSNYGGSTAAGSPQYTWLDGDLTAHAGACTIVTYHHPYKNIGPEGPTTRMDAIWALMRQHQVTMVLNGHDHNYQRWAPMDATGTQVDPNGVAELVVGGGGHGIQAFIASDPLVQASATSFGAVRLELRPDRVDVSYRTPDGAGGREEDSTILPCQSLPADTTAPTAPATVTAVANSTPSAAWSAKLTWTAATDNRGVAQYRIYRDGVVVATVPSSNLTWQDGGLTYSTTYRYRVTALDARGNESTLSPEASVTTGPPSASLTQTFVAAGDTYVSQGSPTARYGAATVLRASNSSNAAMTSFVKFDVAGAYSTITSAKLRLWATAKSNSGLTVQQAATTWNDGLTTAPTWTTQPAVGAQVGSAGSYPTGSWVEVNLTASGLVTGNGTFAVAVKAPNNTQINWASREAGAATAPQLVVVSSPPPDTIAPTVPTGVQATSTTETAATVTWGASTDASGIGSYLIYRDGKLLDTVSGTTLSYVDVTCAPGTTYTYAVAARDPAGNTSAQAAGATVSTPDLTAPEPSSSFTAVLDGPTTARLVWTPATDNVAVTGYRVLRQGKLLATLPPTTTTYVMSDLAAGTKYTFQLRAFDAAGNTSDTLTDSVTTPKATVSAPPTAPTNLSATGLDESTISLGWTAATDDKAVTAYEIFRDGVSAIVLDGAVTTWQDTGLAAGVSHTYTVRAGDADGNWSALSAPATASTVAADTTAPSVPAGVAAAGATTTSIQLSWNASTDDRGVTGYGVYRDGTLVATLGGSTITYLDEGLAVASTHAYRVDAVDAAGNRSAQSDPVSARTIVPPDVIATVAASADAYVNSANATSKYGTATSLRVNGTTTSEMHTFLRFSPTGTLPVIRSAVLTLGATSRVTAITVRTAPGTWSESTITWATKPGPYGTTTVDSPGLAAAGALTIDVTPLVTSGAQVDLVITTTVASQSAFSSREAAAPAVPPTLKITSGY